MAAETLQDILTRFERKIASTGDDNTRAEQRANKPGLLPARHPNRDFFIADILDWALKDDRHSMEHPIFSLSKTPDSKVRHYEHNGIHVTVAPSAYGRATIWDKDILLYCVSVLTEGLNQEREVSRTIRLRAYDFLVTTNRHTGGRDYDLLTAALNRLKGTVINTDIETNGKRQRSGFGLIDNWQIIERSDSSGRMSAVEITLNQWLFNAIVAREILTLNRDYFRLDGGLERRLYELARKHCGRQAKWTVSVDLLHKKSGSQATLKKFRELLRRAAANDALPDYRVRYDQETDRVLFYAKDTAALARHLTAIGTSGTESNEKSGL